MACTILKSTVLSASIDTQIYLCRSFNYEKNNTNTHLSSNAKYKYELVLYNTTCTTHRSALILINYFLMLTQFLLNFLSLIFICNIWAFESLTFYLYSILQITILMNFSYDLRIISIFLHSNFQNENSKKKISTLKIEDLKAINLL